MIFELSLSELLLGAFFCSSATVLALFFAGKLVRRQKRTKPVESPVAEESRDVLVGTLRNRLQLETCIENKFYHIPAARLSQKDFPVHYVAIYRSNHKFGYNAGISIYGKVSRCSLVPRCEIKEIPKNSQEMYYRFDIEEWKTLTSPISASENDFVNIMTTRYLLESSREVPELMLSSRREHELYQKISSCVSGEDNTRKIPYGTADILLDGGRISANRAGTELYACTYADFNKHPSAFFKKIRENGEEQKEKEQLFI
ncbi:MAG: hypothetical protein IJ949_03975 [Oscillospiraceae bacterium]|nr:hypothetical protein [Oscillospiraceae bacterium]